MTAVLVLNAPSDAKMSQSHGGSAAAIYPDPDTPEGIKDRDPHGINQHLRLVFSDVVAEPEESTFSFDQVWVLSCRLFTSSKLWCYRILTLLFAIPAAICWGVTFAFVSFCNIWCYVPCLRAFSADLVCLQKLYGPLLRALVVPLCEAVGRCFSHIHVTSVKAESKDLKANHDFEEVRVG